MGTHEIIAQLSAMPAWAWIVIVGGGLFFFVLLIFAAVIVAARASIPQHIVRTPEPGSQSLSWWARRLRLIHEPSKGSCRTPVVWL